MRLVTKGMSLLVMPTVAQLLILGGFFLLEREVDFYQQRAAQDIDHIDGLTRFFLWDFASAMEIQDAFMRRVPLSAKAEEYLKGQREHAQVMKDFSANFVENRRHMLVLPEEGELKRFKHEHAKRPQMLNMLTASTQNAYDAVQKFQEQPSPRNENNATIFLRFALKHLSGLGDSNFTNGTNPSASLKERELYRGFILLGSVTNLVAVMCVCLLVSRNISRRVNALLRNVERFKSGEEPRGATSGADEISRIDKTFSGLFKDLREAMFPYKAMMEYSQDMICLLDVSGRIISSSNSCIKLLGYAPDELSKAWLSDLVTNDMQPIISENLRKISNGEPVTPFDSIFIRDDKTLVDVLLSLTWSARDQVIFCVAHDITQRKAAERLQQDVMHMVSHDLKTPLNAISNFHEMLEGGLYGDLPEKNLEQVGRAQRSTDRMLTLIRDLLDIEKMKSGMLELEPNLVSLEDIFEQSKESVENLAEKDGITIEVPKTDLLLFADKARLIQVIVNLLSNAIKFSPKNSKIMLSVNLTDQFTIISVADQGRGIPQELQKTIFDRFSQTRSSDATVHGGTGLGLSICKALIELHGGAIRVTSEVGKGSVFQLRLPNHVKAHAEVNS